jgi:hypothetical protein
MAAKWLDIHRHYTVGQSRIEDIVAQIDRDGGAGTVLFGFQGLRSDISQGGQDAEVLVVAHKTKNLTYPFLCDFDPTAESSVQYVEDRLKTGDYYGIGEILIGHSIARTMLPLTVSYAHPVMQMIYAVAAREKVPVLVHVDPPFQEEFLDAVANAKVTKFIWAHVGYDFLSNWGGALQSVEYIWGLLTDHENLFFDISTWIVSPLVMDNDEWCALFEENSDRFLFGTDMTDQYSRRGSWVRGYLDLLQGLSPESRERILHRNARRLLERRG